MDWADAERWTPQSWFYDVSDVLIRHIYERSRRAFEEGDAARDALTTPKAIVDRQRYVRERFLAGIGGLPPSDTPLNARIVGTVPGDGFRIEKVIFESRPQAYVTAHLYLPDGLSAPEAAVLFLCGHHREAKHHPEYQSVCQTLVRAGMIVLAQDPVGQGERLGYYDPETGIPTVNWGTTEHDHAGAQCLPLGDGLARYFLQDALRGLDYLASRPEVDPARIGITGNSGGGTQTSLVLLAAADRIAAAAPTTFIMDRESYQRTTGAQDAEQIWPGFTAAGLDHEDILLALCPKPVQVQAVTGDFFPIEGTRRTAERARRHWVTCGAGDAFRLVEDESDHRYTSRLAKEAARFFARYLRGTEPDDRVSVRPLPPETLWCTTSGQVRGELENARFPYEENLDRLADAAQRRSVSGDDPRLWLYDRVAVGRNFEDMNPRYLFSGEIDGLRLQSCLWRPQVDLFNLGYLFRASARDGETLPVTMALWDDGTRAVRSHASVIQEICASGRAVLVPDTSGVGALLPRSINGHPPHALYGTLHKLACDLLFLDDDLLALRTFEVLRAAEMLEHWPGVHAEGIEILASGRHGICGRLAAALSDAFARVTVVDGPQSWAEWVSARHYDTTGIYETILRGALNHFDLPDLLSVVPFSSESSE
ncbi:MAG: prolyl oligopeptidase family serine peptidase [Capsulimonadales bacterium]|nr:prolyl oligopeptidase family serine peptidase [Capsulimonadales bacterium]